MRLNKEQEAAVTAPDGPVMAVLTSSTEEWADAAGAFAPVSGTHALCFRTSQGALDFAEFTIR